MLMIKIGRAMQLGLGILKIDKIERGEEVCRKEGIIKSTFLVLVQKNIIWILHAVLLY